MIILFLTILRIFFSIFTTLNKSVSNLIPIVMFDIILLWFETNGKQFYEIPILSLAGVSTQQEIRKEERNSIALEEGTFCNDET